MGLLVQYVNSTLNQYSQSNPPSSKSSDYYQICNIMLFVQSANSVHWQPQYKSCLTLLQQITCLNYTSNNSASNNYSIIFLFPSKHVVIWTPFWERMNNNIKCINKLLFLATVKSGGHTSVVVFFKRYFVCFWKFILLFVIELF